MLQAELLCAGPDLLRSRADVRRAGSRVVLRAGSEVLQAQVLQAHVLQAPQAELLQAQVLQAELLRSGPDLLRSGCRPDVLRSRRGSDVRCSRGLLPLI